MKKVFSLSTLFILFSTINIFPQVRGVDIDECINIALQNHPDLFLSIEDNKKSVADYRIAKSLKSIIINGEVRTIENGTNAPGLFGGLVASYNLYDAKNDYVEEIAITNIDISKLKSQKTKNEVLLEVKNAYYGYLLSKNTLKIRETINEKYKKKSDLAKQLFEQGSRPILDVSKAEVDMADSQLQYEKAKNDERKTKLNLFRSMGLEEGEASLINPKDIETIPVIKCTLDELYRMAEIYSPLIRIITLEKRSAILKISEESAAHFPRVDLSLGFGYANPELSAFSNASDNLNTDKWNPSFLGAFKATLPIFSGGQISARVDSAVSDYNKISYKEKELLIDTKNQIRDSYKSLEEIKKQMEISNLITKNAQRHLLLAQRSYENGGGSLLELQDAELSVIRAEIGFLESKYSYLLTLAKLTSIIGIGESSICKNQE
ncbi:MAG TPA: TolC family protein [Spirochaetota bacterium]|nr:TolC family protein [Spirochaetota bacterium]